MIQAQGCDIVTGDSVSVTPLLFSIPKVKLPWAVSYFSCACSLRLVLHHMQGHIVQTTHNAGML
jgi:hypothetical protein